MKGNDILNNNKFMFESIDAIRQKSDKRREVEDRVLAENNLGSKKQLFGENLVKFNGIVDALLEGQEVETKILVGSDRDISEGLFGGIFKKKVAPVKKVSDRPSHTVHLNYKGEISKHPVYGADDHHDAVKLARQDLAAHGGGADAAKVHKVEKH